MLCVCVRACVLLKAPLCNKVSLISHILSRGAGQLSKRLTSLPQCLMCSGVPRKKDLDQCLLYSIKRLCCTHYFLIKTERNPPVFLFNSRLHRPLEEVVWRALENEKPCPRRDK